MNVGIYVDNIMENEGGGYTFQTEIIESLLEINNNSNHSFIIFARSIKSKDFLEQVNKGKFKFVIIPKSTFFKIKTLRMLRKVGSIISPQHAAKIFPNSFDRFMVKHRIKILWFPTPFFEETDLPYIFTLWDLAHRQHPYFPEVVKHGIWAAREYNYSHLLKRASMVIVGTEAGRKEAEIFFQIPKERIKKIPLPTPKFTFEHASKIEPGMIKKHKIPNGYLLYPSQFWAHKNHANLLISLKILKIKYETIIPLVLVGSDKGNESYIKRLTQELNLVSQVLFLGFVKQADLVELYQNALALIYITFFGPDNLPPLEAFALGTPVIASNVSGASEQLGDAALLVDPKNPEDIAEAIYSLFNSVELQNKLVKRGKERALKWTVEDYMQNILSTLDEFEHIRRCWD
jgi:glycosyltransferase involved in cell wall biosynthesis